jgi:hypothetical protein
MWQMISFDAPELLLKTQEKEYSGSMVSDKPTR